MKDLQDFSNWSEVNQDRPFFRLDSGKAENIYVPLWNGFAIILGIPSF